MLHFTKSIMVLIVCYTCGFSQTPIPKQHVALSTNEIYGCLTGAGGKFWLTTEDGKTHTLWGKVQGLDKYIMSPPIKLSGMKSEDGPKEYFKVAKVERAYKEPHSKLDPSFIDVHNWKQVTNQKYGIEYAYPNQLKATDDGAYTQPNFASSQAVITIAKFEIPREIYAGSNFVGGEFAIFANPEISSAESCKQFGESDTRYLSSRRVGFISYTKMESGDVGAGTSYGKTYFHTFQHGICFEVQVVLATYDRSNQDGGCMVATANSGEVTDLLLNHIGYIDTSLSEMPSPATDINLGKH